jgi:hypothetical protein
LRWLLRGWEFVGAGIYRYKKISRDSFLVARFMREPNARAKAKAIEAGPWARRKDVRGFVGMTCRLR